MLLQSWFLLGVRCTDDRLQDKRVGRWASKQGHKFPQRPKLQVTHSLTTKGKGPAVPPEIGIHRDTVTQEFASASHGDPAGHRNSRSSRNMSLDSPEVSTQNQRGTVSTDTDVLDTWQPQVAGVVGLP